jgi:hypothetical protein
MSQKVQAGGGKPVGGDFVSRLVSDPAKPPQTTLLSGYVGASDEEGHTRIYFDPQLSDYVDVATEDVLHTEPAGGTGPLSPTLVWIRRDAQVLHGQAGSTRQRAGFFEGRVWRENFGVTVAGRPGRGRLEPGELPTPVTMDTVCNCGPRGIYTPVINPTPFQQRRRVYGPPAPGPLEGSAGAAAAGTGEGGEDSGLQGSGDAGADTVSQGSGGAGTDTVAYGSGGGPGILPSEWCPSAGLPCPPRTMACPPPTFRCPPRTALCPRTYVPYCPPPTVAGCRTRAPFCPDPSAVDACPTRFCPPG